MALVSDFGKSFPRIEIKLGKAIHNTRCHCFDRFSFNSADSAKLNSTGV